VPGSSISLVLQDENIRTETYVSHESAVIDLKGVILLHLKVCHQRFGHIDCIPFVKSRHQKAHQQLTIVREEGPEVCGKEFALASVRLQDGDQRFVKVGSLEVRILCSRLSR
jgi:glutamate formiminotransferase